MAKLVFMYAFCLVLFVLSCLCIYSFLPHLFAWQALGCILYLLCFKQHPFEEGAKLQIVNGKYSIPQNDAKYTVYHNLISTARPSKKKAKKNNNHKIAVISMMNCCLWRSETHHLVSLHSLRSSVYAEGEPWRAAVHHRTGQPAARDRGGAQRQPQVTRHRGKGPLHVFLCVFIRHLETATGPGRSRQKKNPQCLHPEVTTFLGLPLLFFVCCYFSLLLANFWTDGTAKGARTTFLTTRKMEPDQTENYRPYFSARMHSMQFLHTSI